MKADTTAYAEGASARKRDAKPLVQPGSRFGRLTVIAFAGSNDGRVWRCACACGGETHAKTGHLRAGAVQSCGCLVREVAAATGRISGPRRRTHGLSRSRLDTTFDNMVKRCEHPGTNRYERYGGRGISICSEWRADRSAFYAWALANGYAAGLWIERVDPDGNYEPGNCRWASPKEQANNTSRSRCLTCDGVTRTVAEWAEHLGVAAKALQHRVNRGWAVERIFNQPFRGAA